MEDLGVVCRSEMMPVFRRGDPSPAKISILYPHFIYPRCLFLERLADPQSRACLACIKNGVAGSIIQIGLACGEPVQGNHSVTSFSSLDFVEKDAPNDEKECTAET